MPVVCKGWDEPAVARFAAKYALVDVRYDGCCFDVRDKKGNLVSMPRRLMTDNPMLAGELGGKEPSREGSRYE